MTTPLELAELLEEGPRRAGDAFIASELRRLALVEAEHAALKEELEAEREETKRWRNAAKWEQEIRKQAEMIADKAVTEHAALLKAISDAEPVAWRLHPFDYGVGHEGVYAVTQFPQQLAAWEKKGWAANPLYTLNGIKKP